jgi:hypothetical protein
MGIGVGAPMLAIQAHLKKFDHQAAPFGTEKA